MLMATLERPTSKLIIETTLSTFFIIFESTSKAIDAGS